MKRIITKRTLTTINMQVSNAEPMGRRRVRGQMAAVALSTWRGLCSEGGPLLLARVSRPGSGADRGSHAMQ